MQEKKNLVILFLLNLVYNLEGNFNFQGIVSL